MCNADAEGTSAVLLEVRASGNGVFLTAGHFAVRRSESYFFVYLVCRIALYIAAENVLPRVIDHGASSRATSKGNRGGGLEFNRGRAVGN